MTNTEQRLTALEKLLFETDQYRNSSGAYKVYTALLNQSGTNAPVATVLQNTLESIPTYSFVGAGKYYITCTGCFTENKTFFSGTGVTHGFEPDEGQHYVYYKWINEDTLKIMTGNGDVVDSELSNHSIEIRVYQ